MKEGCRRIVRSTLLDAETLLQEPENPPAEQPHSQGAHSGHNAGTAAARESGRRRRQGLPQPARRGPGDGVLGQTADRMSITNTSVSVPLIPADGWPLLP